MQRILCVALLITALACQTKPKQETAAAAPAEDSAAILAKRPGPDAPRTAADRLVRALYFEHSKKQNPLLERKDRALIDQFFTKSLADQIWQDATSQPGKLNRTKNNPLFMAPAEEVKKMWVEPGAVAGTRAVVYVTFEQKAKPQELRVTMEQQAGRWRISDIRYPDGKQLTELL
ncbi:DUF3828 domain-containing protein [Spirosoma rigui]|uniref:DUF3828 domain-containing protein n=1 Tax=Spirosoma rigui TaxID=564064 RepID=UPI0009B02DC6|nr:DUF3828 domain-containing protein [Spirosoma rigui]